MIWKFSGKLNRRITPIIFCVQIKCAVLEYDVIQRRKILVGKLWVADKVLNSQSVPGIQLIDVCAGIYQYPSQFHRLLYDVLRARKENVK